MAKFMSLNGLIYAQFKSKAAFAAYIGMTKQKLNKLISGDQVPTLYDIADIAKGLNVPFMMIANIFLEEQSTNV